MIKLLKKIFLGQKPLTLEEHYLNSSTNLAELERRMKEIENGRAPWQVRAGYYI
jgi:hypothetical protein